MKLLPSILLVILLISCLPDRKQALSESDNETIQMLSDTDSLVMLDWQTTQDSLRKVLLKSKPDNFLKGSMLVELYIRNVITISDDSLYLNIPFNLHSFDCGAPDCYSTDLKFGFPHHNQLMFPDEITYGIHEHGCVDSELHLSGVMSKINQDDNFVSYYLKELHQTLIILADDERKEYAYLFEEVEPDSIQMNRIQELLSNLPDTASVPYRSFQLITPEYEIFLGENR
ncbi:hypothetical protein [Fulvivirga ligni]|uniref:hypothetical protein n=1 Tax=Fulvivirga ligni TaxID=2904246 RepID=UPI001F370A90|nr:hypothetical protein [Fulvivirga ligni]UII20311.1 hypothetical protein LVD16_20940 [Fulvivirga ligni]